MRALQAALILVACLEAAAALADDTPARLRAGDAAPAFTAVDDQSRAWKSAEHVGKNIVVVWFYQADFTPSAVKEALQFREDLDELGEREVELVGVSGDSVGNHQLFKKTYELNFTLLADKEGSVARSFGLPVAEGGTIRVKVAGREQTLTRSTTTARRIFAVDLEGKIAFDRPKVDTLKDMDVVFALLARDFWANREDRQPVWQPKIGRDWKRVLTRNQYSVARGGQTELPYANRYWNTKTHGTYRCLCCGQVLFNGETKFHSGTGWPSFFAPADTKAVTFNRDTSSGMDRVEVKCSRCDAHLGHVFPDGPLPTGERYCMNSASLLFEPADKPDAKQNSDRQ